MSSIYNKKITEINNKKKEIDIMINKRNKIKQELLQIIDFKIPLYIIDDIAQNEDYSHICLMINIATINNRLTYDNASVLKKKIKKFLKERKT